MNGEHVEAIAPLDLERRGGFSLVQQRGCAQKGFREATLPS